MEGSRPKSRADILRRVDFLIGGLVGAVGAIAAAALAAGHSWQVWVPLVFSAVLLVIARIFGVHAGILGTVLAGMIFAVFLFHPAGSARDTSVSARANLGWMLLIGIVFSFLFAPTTSGLRRP